MTQDQVWNVFRNALRDRVLAGRTEHRRWSDFHLVSRNGEVTIMERDNGVYTGLNLARDMMKAERK